MIKLVWLTVAFGVCLTLIAKANSKKPNIVIVVADDLVSFY